MKPLLSLPSPHIITNCIIFQIFQLSRAPGGSNTLLSCVLHSLLVLASMRDHLPFLNLTIIFDSCWVTWIPQPPYPSSHNSLEPPIPMAHPCWHWDRNLHLREFTQALSTPGALTNRCLHLTFPGFYGLCPTKRAVEVLTPITSECDFLGNKANEI